jgi:hypothetical protein
MKQRESLVQGVVGGIKAFYCFFSHKMGFSSSIKSQSSEMKILIGMLLRRVEAAKEFDV